jgi:hypothetical protein
MWRDPLDELIEGIEQTLPPLSEPEGGWTDACLIGCQLFVCAVLWHTEEDVDRVKQDWRVKAYFKELERQRREREGDELTKDSKTEKSRGD